MMRARIASALAAAIALPVVATAAEAFDWTGTYEGFVVCDNVAAGNSGSFARPMTLAIEQTGDLINARNMVEVAPSQAAAHTLFRGRVMASGAGSTVSGYLEVCDATFPHKEMIRIFPAASAQDPFAFAADTVFVSEAVPGMDGELVVESCKWSLTRTSTARPSFESCP